MKIAIIGSGISGLVCAHLLYRDHDISIFEANDYIGGHTHTIDVRRDDISYAVDTGFIVFNRSTYPNFCSLLEKLSVASQPTSMNFSVRCDRTGLEYGSESINTLFAQRKNILSFPFWWMVLEIFKLRRHLVGYLTSNSPDMSMGEFLHSTIFAAFHRSFRCTPWRIALVSGTGKDTRVPCPHLWPFFREPRFSAGNKPN